MFSLFLGIFGTWLALAGFCQAGNLERSSLTPLSIVYTVYPYYNSETLLGVWKPEEPLQISANVAVGRTSEERKIGNPENSTSRDESTSDSNTRDSYRDHSNESNTHSRDEPATEITYWPPVQRGAAPKPRTARTTMLQSPNLKKTA